tara:strand:- start:218 stop:439 length:222 start_codon:yes stop_codon:yes gene_type:complete
MIDSIDKPSPKATTDSIIASGPKNTRAYVAMASANQLRGVTNEVNHFRVPFKTFGFYTVNIEQLIGNFKSVSI